MQIFQYESYREWLSWRLKQPAEKSYGAALKLSKAIGVSSVLMSQILSGQRKMQLEQALKTAEYMHLNKKETQYFLVMVSFENAGTRELAAYWQAQMHELSQKAQEIKEQIKSDIELDEISKAEFYSHWMYSAVRLSTDIPGHHDPETIAGSLGLSTEVVSKVLAFLVNKNLCTLNSGQYKMGAQSTFLERESPWIYSRQLQWRQKAIEKMNGKDEKNVFFTGPMVLGAKDFQWISENLIKKTVGEATKRAIKAPSEKLACLNIDWFLL